MPVYAPSGPKSATNRSLDSGILHVPLLLFSLSTPKTIIENMFTPARKTNRVEVWNIVIRKFFVMNTEIKVNGGAEERIFLQCVIVDL